MERYRLRPAKAEMAHGQPNFESSVIQELVEEAANLQLRGTERSEEQTGQYAVGDAPFTELDDFISTFNPLAYAY